MARLGTALLTLLVAGAAFAAGDSCPAGFGGTRCAVCQSDQACVDSTGYPDATCSKDLAFAPNSELKVFSCTIKDANVAQLIIPDSVLVQCHSPVASNETVMGGSRRLLSRELFEETTAPAYCEMSLAISPSIAASTIICTAEDCDLSGTTVSCQSTSCICDPVDCGSALVSGVLVGIKGSAGLECDDTGVCKIMLSGLPVGDGSIMTTCTASECLSPMEE